MWLRVQSGGLYCNVEQKVHQEIRKRDVTMSQWPARVQPKDNQPDSNVFKTSEKICLSWSKALMMYGVSLVSEVFPLYKDAIHLFFHINNKERPNLKADRILEKPTCAKMLNLPPVVTSYFGGIPCKNTPNKDSKLSIILASSNLTLIFCISWFNSKSLHPFISK